MRLTYKILWFEDNDDFFEGLLEHKIEDHLMSIGFQMQLDRMSGIESKDTVVSAAKKADLIVMDFALDGTSGGDFIRQIRDGNINTEVVFYSTVGISDLREAVKTRELDGVFCRGRDGIADEVIPIIDSTLRKILDLENSRGLVMAEVGEIDKMMDSFIKTAHSLSGDKQSIIHAKLIERLEGQATSLNKTIKTLKSAGVEEILEVLDTNKRLNTVASICKILQIENDELHSFNDSVLNKRNFLAHGIAVEIEEGYEFTHKENTYQFTETSSVELRKNLIAFRQLLESLSAKLSPNETPGI